MCYVGKATKIFIFIVTVLVVVGIVFGFGLLRRSHRNNAVKCSDGTCNTISAPDSSGFLLPSPPPPSYPASPPD
ncbi:hypothetical protein RJT34_31161 [Clitoria ternatea]|uniref:Transmembrane protein n=1 Tax=Clitoria ternatea TaxID=43366 RepID=A0AAN9EV01_CLITE